MSDMWMPCHPRIDEPSKPTPSSNVPSSHVSMGYEQCCQLPRKSMNFRSTISALCFLAYSKNCFGVMAPPECEKWPSRSPSAGPGHLIVAGGGAASSDGEQRR